MSIGVMLRIVLIGLCCFFANANEVQLQVVTEEWVPYNFTNAKGEIDGRATHKVREILADANISYEIRSYPWARSMKLAKTKKNTMIYSIYRTPEREPSFLWACPLLQPVKEYLFKLKTRKDIQLNSLDDAKKHLISVVRGSVSNEFLIKNGFENGKNIDITADPSSSPRKLLAGYTDLIMTTEYTAFESMKKLGVSFDQIEIALEVTNTNNNRACLAFSPSSDMELVEQVRAALARHNLRSIGP
ncbi:transporter substrate-binding domain-containing protein [Pseudoalteromonas sp. MMG005]